IARGAQVSRRIERAKTLPVKFAVEPRASGPSQAAGEDHHPTAVPGGLRALVNAPVSELEPARAGGGQRVETAPTVALGFQPAVFHQTEDAGADDAFADFKRSEQIDELTQPDGAAMRLNGVAKHGGDQGFGARAIAREQVEQGAVDFTQGGHNR